MAEYTTVAFKAQKIKNEWFIIPSFGIIDERNYYGYPVIAIAFAWLRWRCKFEFGVRKWRVNNG